MVRRRLLGESAAFELNNYDLGVLLGKTALLLSAREAGVGVALADEAEESAAEAIRWSILPSEHGLSINQFGVELFDRDRGVKRAPGTLDSWTALERRVASDIYVSRKHLELLAITPVIVEVKDLGSTNGTFVEPLLPNHP